MSVLIIHIGAPRTGTTVLQKHLFPKSSIASIISKRAFDSSLLASNPLTPGQASFELADLRTILINTDPYKDPLLYLRAIMACLVGTSRNVPFVGYEELLQISVERIVRESKKLQVLFSSERLCDSAASLQGDSVHTMCDTQFGVYSLAKAANKAMINSCKVSLCLRAPISYLRSKFIRTTIQRTRTNFRILSPREYIKKQATLELNCPGTSALTPAMHAEFIKQLQRHAFVKAFGFQELLKSDDVFSLLGLQGEKEYAFRDFPKENRFPFTREQEREIEIEISQALKFHGLYDRIMKAQMFE